MTPSGEENTKDGSEIHNHDNEATEWTCSMHPQIRMEKPGQCPICGMDLIPLVETGDETMSDEVLQMTEQAVRLAEIQTFTVRTKHPGKNIYLQGILKADERNIAGISARFGGRIEELYVNFTGQKVNKGDKLASVYSPELVTAIRELREAAKHKTKNPSLYNSAVNKLRLWGFTERQIEKAESEDKPLPYFDIISPLAGTVTARKISKGDYVKEGSLMFEITDLSKIWVILDAYESDLQYIKEGNTVEFKSESFPGKTFTGRISFIDPVVTADRTVKVRLETVNRDGMLKPGMFVDAVVKTRLSGKKAVIIPKTAVLWTGRKSVVFIKIQTGDNPAFMYREIVVSGETDDYYIVKEGLSEGEEVVANGVFKVDAAAQLAGKPSMMNPPAEAVEKSKKTEVRETIPATEMKCAPGKCGSGM